MSSSCLWGGNDDQFPSGVRTSTAISRSASNASAARKLLICRVATPPPRTSTPTARAGTYAAVERPGRRCVRERELAAALGSNDHLRSRREIDEVRDACEHVRAALELECLAADLDRARAGEGEGHRLDAVEHDHGGDRTGASARTRRPLKDHPASAGVRCTGSPSTAADPAGRNRSARTARSAGTVRDMRRSRIALVVLAAVAAVAVVASARPIEPTVRFTDETPGDLREVTTRAWERFTAAFPGRRGCTGDVTVGVAWELPDRARYEPEPGLVLDPRARDGGQPRGDAPPRVRAPRGAPLSLRARRSAVDS